MFFDAIITYSLRNKLVIGMMVLLLAFWGIRAYTQLPIDAVPDITNNQVQIITQSPALAALEIEQLITSPLEISMSNLPSVEEVRSISRFGLSVITVVFNEDADLYKCRQLTTEQIKKAEADIPANIGRPQLAPITTGLGEIYQYTISVDPGYELIYNLAQIRTVQDWIVKRQLSGVPGVIEVSSFGGEVKEYEVAIDPAILQANKTTLAEVYAALGNNNSNTGGSYLEKAESVYFIRAEGMIKTLADIENSVVKTVNGTPLLIRHIGKVRWGHAVRFGAMTINGKGETAGGIVMMLRGANSAKVTEAVKIRIAEIQKSMPKGLKITSFLDRSKLVNSAISTVATNLIEGGLIVIFVLVLLLGNLRAGLIVASVIPLAMLFAVGMMSLFGISANLMSLGAIDFGLVVDGAVIIVESIYYHLVLSYAGLPGKLNQKQLDHVVHDAALGIRKSASFGEIIILMVYLPILALVGIEGKMFRPMAETVIFTIIGALILSLTWVPVASALFMPRRYSLKPTLADRFIRKCQLVYLPVLKASLRHGAIVLVVSLSLFVVSIWQLTRLGGEFMPELDEGDFAVETRLPAGSSLSETIKVTTEAEKILLKYPEVLNVIGKIGTSEIPTDPMPLESADLMVILKPRKEWPDPHKQRDDLAAELEEAISVLPGVAFEFQQPIQMRFNELMTGVRSDVAIKIYGDSLHTLFDKANELAAKLKGVEGVNAIKVEAIGAVPQLRVVYDRPKLAAYGLNIQEVNQLIESSFSGGYAGQVYEGERRFGLVIRLDSAVRHSPDQLARLLVPLPNGGVVPLGNIATVGLVAAPMQISRDNTRRRVVVGVGVAGRDMESVVNEIKAKIAPQVKLPMGYYMTYGGQFQNFESAKSRLMIAVPLALLLIFILLYVTFNSVVQAMLIFTAIPLSAIGGIWALTLRDMPFSISAGVGFIALFGVAVLNGIVLISHLNGLKLKGHNTRYSILEGAIERLRPVMLTALVASLGFIPMALSTSGGAEVQRPLATVVIGGLITSTLLTLVVLPILYLLADRWKNRKVVTKAVIMSLLLFVLIGFGAQAQQPRQVQQGNQAIGQPLTLNAALTLVAKQNRAVAISRLELDQTLKLIGTAFDPARTTLDYQYGQTQIPNRDDYTVIMGQTFSLPQLYNAQKQVYEAHAGGAEARLNLTQAQINLQVRNLYYQYLTSLRRSAIWQQQINVYADVAKVASNRFKAGESIKLEYLSANARNQELNLVALQEVADRLELVSELAYLLKLDVAGLIPDTNNLAGRTINLTAGNLLGPDTITHPELMSAKTSLISAQAQAKLEGRRLLPEVKLGYGNQSIDGVAMQQFTVLGLNVPLFYQATNKRKEAAQIASKAAEANVGLVQARLQKEINMRTRIGLQYQQQVLYYERTGLQQAQELVAVGLKTYLAGEIDYSEYVLSSAQAWDTRRTYLDIWQKAQINYNILQYLQGQ